MTIRETVRDLRDLASDAVGAVVETVMMPASIDGPVPTEPLTDAEVREVRRMLATTVYTDSPGAGQTPAPAPGAIFWPDTTEPVSEADLAVHVKTATAAYPTHPAMAHAIARHLLGTFTITRK